MGTLLLTVLLLSPAEDAAVPGLGGGWKVEGGRWEVLQARDRWFGEDKLKHLFTSTAVVGFGHATARTVVSSEEAVIPAVLGGVAAGLWKEWYDRRRGRPFSGRDLLYDAVGVALGAALVSRAR